ncbi:MAG: DUF3109 family protein [Flavobacteriales bacterium]|nr:DUF3109 family protein [Flavobacteriales bacterium]
MFLIGSTLVSEEILENDFVCNLSACKGQCCVGGDAGAPVTQEEVEILKKVYPIVKPLLRPSGVETIESQGTSVVGHEGELETPLINGNECAYVIYDNKTAICGIEQAYNQGLITFKKPVSCHLYPVRVKQLKEFQGVNYDRWEICDDACQLGKSLGVPVYHFVKEALIRKFGAAWYEELELVAQELKKQRDKE